MCVYMFPNVYMHIYFVTIAYAFHSEEKNSILWEVTFWVLGCFLLIIMPWKIVDCILFLPIFPPFSHVLYLFFANKYSQHGFEWNGNCVYQIILSGINFWLSPSLTQKPLLAPYCLQNKLYTPTFSTLHNPSLYFHSHFSLVVCPNFRDHAASPPHTMLLPNTPTIWILSVFW